MQTLSLRQLNRTTLARQLVLERSNLSVADATYQVAGLQAQVQNPPYIGLWTRLKTFTRSDLMNALEQRAVVRTTFMRSTLHLVTADDYLNFRQPLQPALTKAYVAFHSKTHKAVDLDAVTAFATERFAEKPRGNAEIKALLLETFPTWDGDTMAYAAVRSHVPVVQMPPGGFWGVGGSPLNALAPLWLNRLLQPSDDPRPLLKRYLRAFGPATVADAQLWTGLTRLKDAFASMRDELVAYRDEQGRELYDLPDLSLVDEDTPIEVRFMPEYDNLIIAHDDRSRVIADAYRPLVFLSAGRVRATILVDGFVQGAWKIERNKATATLIIEFFAPITATIRQTLEAEGEKLVRWIDDQAQTVMVQFIEA